MDDSACNIACTSNANEFCGGRGANQVRAVGCNIALVTLLQGLFPALGAVQRDDEWCPRRYKLELRANGFLVEYSLRVSEVNIVTTRASKRQYAMR